MSGPTIPRPTDATSGLPGAVAAVSPIARLHRHGASRPSAVSAAEREHATEVVAHLLHRECGQWSWTAHAAAAHREEAGDIVGALCREGWGPGRSAA